MKITNHQHLPQTLVDACSDDDYTRGVSDFTVTELINPPQMIQLRQRHDHELEEDVSNMLWALQGKLIHTLLEKVEQAFPEERLYMDFAGEIIGGKMDRIVIHTRGNRVEITDWKYSTVYSLMDGMKPEWEQQLNLYAELLAENGFRPVKLQIGIIYRDWMKTKARVDKSYPQYQAELKPVDLWDKKKRRAFLAGRVNAHVSARDSADDKLPYCTAEERWAANPTYAVMKKGGKRALKVCKSIQEAESYAIDKGWAEQHETQVIWQPPYGVVMRPGHPGKRCELYCLAAPFCHQRPVEFADWTDPLTVDGGLTGEP